MKKNFLKDYGIEDVLNREQNKFKGLVIIMKETRRILKELFGSDIESPGEKAIKESIKNFTEGEIEIRRVAS